LTQKASEKNHLQHVEKNLRKSLQTGLLFPLKSWKKEALSLVIFKDDTPLKQSMKHLKMYKVLPLFPDQSFE